MSPKAWVVTSVVLLMACSAIGWFIWSGSPRHSAALPSQNAMVAAASSAQSDKAAPASRVHIEGCAGYVQPPYGEMLEPRVLPGAPIEEFRQTYGKETPR